MRRYLAAAFVASSLLFLAPFAAQAEPWNCYCGEIGAECALNNSIESTSMPTTECVKACEQKSKEMCNLTKGSVDTGSAAIKPQSGKTVQLQDPLKLSGGIPQLVNNIIRAAVGVVGAFALLIFVYGGFLLLTSSGEAAKIQAGKDAMKWAAIGVAVVFSSYALVSFVLKALT